jgi:hypothetical protein
MDCRSIAWSSRFVVTDYKIVPVVLGVQHVYSLSSLYEDSRYEILLIRTFIMKRIPSAWLVIRTRTRSSGIFRQFLQIKIPSKMPFQIPTHRKPLVWCRGSWWVALRGLVVSVLATGSRVQTQPRSMDFKGDKICSTPSFGAEVKPSVPCRFTACKRTLRAR